MVDSSTTKELVLARVIIRLSGGTGPRSGTDAWPRVTVPWRAECVLRGTSVRRSDGSDADSRIPHEARNEDGESMDLDGLSRRAS